MLPWLLMKITQHPVALVTNGDNCTLLPRLLMEIHSAINYDLVGLDSAWVCN